MKNKIVSGNGKTYRRLTKSSARKAFESGSEVYVMSIDRDPISSFSSPYIYYNGCKSLCGWFNGNTEITTFDELLEDLPNGLILMDMVICRKNMMQNITDFHIG